MQKEMNIRRSASIRMEYLKTNSDCFQSVKSMRRRILFLDLSSIHMSEEIVLVGEESYQFFRDIYARLLEDLQHLLICRTDIYIVLPTDGVALTALK